MFKRNEIVERPLGELYDYWQTCKGGKGLPARADIDPTEIPALLPHLLLLDAADRLADFRYRLFGTELCRGFGEDRTGTCLGDYEPQSGFDEGWAEGHRRVFESGEPDYCRDRPVTESDPQRRYARLLLPLSAGDKVDMILGGIVFYLRFSDEEETD